MSDSDAKTPRAEYRTKPRKLMAAHNFGLFLGSHPTPSLPFVEDDLEVEGKRRVHCRRYGNCVDYAAAKDWDGFHCQNCPIEETMSEADYKDDLHGLAAFLRELFVRKV